MSNLSELLPTGGGQNAVDFVASGTLSSGQTVVLNSDGTVSAISPTGAIGPIDPPTAETAVQIFSTEVNRTVAYYDTVNNKVVAIYDRASSDYYGMVSLGTISGSTITFGTPIVYASARTSPLSVVYLSGTSKCVLAIERASGDNQVTVGSVSGTSFSIGTQYNYSAANSNSNSMVYDPDQDKVVHAFNDYGVPLNNYGTLRVYTISGTSISLGSKIVFASSSTSVLDLAYDTENAKVVIAYEDQSDGQRGKALVATISGSTASFGSAVYYDNSGRAGPCSLSYEPVAKKIAFFWRSDSANANKASVGTVSGTSISFGTAVTFSTPKQDYLSSVYCPDTGYIIVTNEQYMRTATISGTSISFGTQATYRGTTVRTVNTVYDTAADKVVIANRIGSSDFDATVVNVTGPVSNNTDFIGITAAAISDTATGAVNVYGGINEAQTGLTIGADYYVQNDGSISTTSSAVKIGQAISATTINMMDLT